MEFVDRRDTGPVFAGVSRPPSESPQFSPIIHTVHTFARSAHQIGVTSTTRPGAEVPGQVSDGLPLRGCLSRSPGTSRIHLNAPTLQQHSENREMECRTAAHRKRRYPAPRRSNAVRSAPTRSALIDSAVATTQASFSPILRFARRCNSAHRLAWARCTPWIENRCNDARAAASSIAPSRSSSTVATETTSGRPRKVGRNLRAGPCSPCAVSRSRATRNDVSSTTGRLTVFSDQDRGPYPLMR
jgi:hypothetical protein